MLAYRLVNLKVPLSGPYTGLETTNLPGQMRPWIVPCMEIDQEL